MECVFVQGIACFIVLYVSIRDVDAVSASEMKTHLTNTFSNYDKRVRPVTTDQSQLIDVTLDLYLIGVNNFYSSEQKLETTAYLEIKWTDEVLGTAWDNSDVADILIPQDDVWVPDLALQNGFESLTGLGNKFHNIKIEKTGQVTWKPYHVFDSACTIDVTYFPFDKTTCELKYVIWTNPKNLLLAKKGTKGLDLGVYGTNSEWDILSTSAADITTDTGSGVIFTIEMKRKPLFYLLNILVPVIMLAVLNPFVFALPAASGEKTGFAVTAFLAFAVFLTIISSELPQNSEKVSAFSAYLFLMTLGSTLIALITIVELRLSSRSEEIPVPGALQSITKRVRRMGCRDCCADNGGYIRGLQMHTMKRRLAEDVTWGDAVDALDFVFFWIFFLITMLATIACFVIAAIGGAS